MKSYFTVKYIAYLCVCLLSEFAYICIQRETFNDSLWYIAKYAVLLNNIHSLSFIKAWTAFVKLKKQNKERVIHLGVSLRERSLIIVCFFRVIPKRLNKEERTSKQL